MKNMDRAAQTQRLGESWLQYLTSHCALASHNCYQIVFSWMDMVQNCEKQLFLQECEGNLTLSVTHSTALGQSSWLSR